MWRVLVVDGMGCEMLVLPLEEQVLHTLIRSQREREVMPSLAAILVQPHEETRIHCRSQL